MTGTPGPKWASWSYNKAHLSGRFHSSIDGFDSCVTWLKTNPICSDTMEMYPQSRSLVVCLGVGMLLRDIHVVQFGGEGSGVTLDPTIADLQNSHLEWGHSQQILRMCTSIVEVMKTCLSDTERQEPEAFASKGQKEPPSKHRKKQPERYES